MSSLVPLLSALSLFSFSSNDSAKINNIIYDNKITLLQENSVEKDFNVDNILLNTKSKEKGDNSDFTHSQAFTDIEEHLEDYYDDYIWYRVNEKCKFTSDVSGAIPIQMQSKYFEKKELEEAIFNAHVANYTNYGGCGPIALMGILDYFSRYLGYNDLIKNPYDSEQRIALATEILGNTDFSYFSRPDATFVWPQNLVRVFNAYVEHHNLKDVISAETDISWLGLSKDRLLGKVVNSIDNGIPVTMCVGFNSGSGYFSKHCTNIYGYETWRGTNRETGETLDKVFVKARLNWYNADDYYCDSDILGDSQVAIITYKLNFKYNTKFNANYFSSFVNDEGRGQYFFKSKQSIIEIEPGERITTNRLRTSFIEDKYLILSSNRRNAGAAYLDLKFDHKVDKLVFDSTLWGKLEGLENKFRIQYYKNGSWYDCFQIDTEILPKDRNVFKSFVALFPRGTFKIRFYEYTTNPITDFNKGRILLDNFEVYYNNYY